MNTRGDHLNACKRAALAFLATDRARVGDGLHLMIDQMREHPDLADHVGISIGIARMQSGEIATKDAERAFIEGFN